MTGWPITENSPVVTFDDSNGPTLTHCETASEGCRTYTYKQFFETGHDSPIISAPHFKSIFITANGGLIATQDYYDAYCNSSMPDIYSTEGIIQELCRIPTISTPTTTIESK